jgi:hypothetical protein
LRHNEDGHSKGISSGHFRFLFCRVPLLPEGQMAEPFYGWLVERNDFRLLQQPFEKAVETAS